MAGELWAVIQRYIDNQRYRPSERQIANELGVSPQAMTKWKRPVGLPARDSLVAIARLTGVPYRQVLDAVLVDIDYLPKESDGDGNAPPTNRPALTAAEWDETYEDLHRQGLSDRMIRSQLPPRPTGAAGAGEVPGVTPGVDAGHGTTGQGGRRRA